MISYLTNPSPMRVLVVAVIAMTLSWIDGLAPSHGYYLMALVFGTAVIDHLHGIRAALNRLESPRPTGLS